MPAGTYTFKGTADMKAHDRAIEQSTEKVKQFQEQTDKATNSSQNLNNVNYNKAFQSQATLQRNIKNTTTLLNGMQGNMLGAISKFGPYAAAAVAGFKLIESAIDKARSVNETFNDQMETMTARMKGAWDEFANRVSRFNWDHFLSGLATAAKYAGQLAQSLDKQGTYNRTSDVDVAQISNIITAYRIEVDKLLNEVKRLRKEQGSKVDTSAQEKAIEHINGLIDEQKNKLIELYNIRRRNAYQAASNAAAYMGINTEEINNLYNRRGVNKGNMKAALGFMSGNTTGQLDVGRLMSFFYDDIESPMLN